MASSRVGIIPDGEKQVLLDRYLDIVWLDDVSEVECVRCHRVPIHHYLSNCQHLFCRNCQRAYSDGGQWKCPQCHTYVTNLNEQNWQLEERIYQIRAHCPNKKYGCTYQGQLSTMPGHLRRCDDTSKTAFPAEFIGVTLDTVSHQVAKIKVTIGEMRSEVRELINNVNVLMVELNEQHVNVEHVQQVQNDVKELEVACETNWTETETLVDGLDTNLRRLAQDLNDKNKQFTNGQPILKEGDTVDMEYLNSQLQQLQTLYEVLTEQLNEQKEQSANKERALKDIAKSETRDALEMQNVRSSMQMPHEALKAMTRVYDWHIRDIKMKDGEFNDVRDSEVFALTGYHYSTKTNLRFTSVSIHLQLVIYDTNKTLIDRTPMPKFTFVIESQSDSTPVNQHHRDVITTKFIRFNDSLDYGNSWTTCLFSKFLKSPPYLVSNGMKLRLYIEPPSIARSFFSNDGILLWRLDNYKERKQMEVDGIIDWQESPYFYTSPQGYRVLLSLYLSEETVCGVLCFLKGEFDSSLTYEFPHRLTVTIFNHTNQSKNLVLRAEGKEADYTSVEFETCSASSLERGGYVADDSLLIKAVIEPS